MDYNHDNLLARISYGLFLVAFVIYGVGVYLVGIYPCTHLGPDTLMFAVAVSVFSTGVLAARAAIKRSSKAWALLASSLLLVVIMYVLVGVFVIGCRG